MKVLLFCAKGFETMEFSPFIDVFGWARNDYGYDVEVVTCGFTRQVVSTFGVTVTMDKTIDEIVVDEYDAIAIPGGFEEYDFYSEAFDQRLSDLILAFANAKKIIASVCVGALAIAKTGLLKNRRATTYHLGNGRRQAQLAEFGAIVVNEPIVVDDTIITSWCPQTAPYVALRLLEMLLGTEAADTVKNSMGF